MLTGGVVFPFPLSREMGFDPGVFGRFDLAALVQPHLKFLLVCLLCPAAGRAAFCLQTLSSSLQRRLQHPCSGICCIIEVVSY